MAGEGYGETSTYKLMGSHVYLIPVNDRNIYPDQRILTGSSLLILCLIVGWFRANRKLKNNL